MPASLSPSGRYLLASLWLTACAMGPDYKRPTTPDAATSLRAPTNARVQFILGADEPGAWWQVFGAPALNALETRALAHNPSLQATRATLRQAQEMARAQTGAYFPQLAAQINRTRQELSPAESGVAGLQGYGSETFSVYDAQLNIAYNFDVWGQTSRRVEAAKAATAYQQFVLQGAATMLAANVAQAAIQTASLRAQIATAQSLIAAEQRLLATVHAQFAAGAANGSDLAAQEAQLANTQALLPPLLTQLEQTQHRLSAYLGQMPSDTDISTLTLAGLHWPNSLPLSQPANLLDQRPDIRAAEAQLQQASANVGIAIANRLPQFTLSAFIGTAPGQLGQAFTPGNGIFEIVSQATAPLFQGGTLRHQQRAAIAAAQAAALTYRATIVNAFQNVADALTALQGDAATLAATQRAETAAARNLHLAQTQYEAGSIAYLNVLTAQAQYQNAALALVRAKAAQLNDAVAFLAALGGGWWNRNNSLPGK